MAENNFIANGSKKELPMSLYIRGRLQDIQTATTHQQIPVSVIKTLVVLGPVIHVCAQCVAIVTWKSPRPLQFTGAAALWVFCCLWTFHMLTIGIPALLLLKIARDWLKVNKERTWRQRPKEEHVDKRETEDPNKNDNYNYNGDDKPRQQQQCEQEFVTRQFQNDDQLLLDNIFQDLNVLDEYIHQLRQRINWLAENINGAHSEMVVSVIIILMYAWPAWIGLNWILGTNGTLAALGLLALTSNAPWFKAFVITMRQNIMTSHLIASVWACYATCITLFLTPFSSIDLFVNSQQAVAPKKKLARITEWVSQLIEHVRNKKAKALHVIRNTKVDCDAVLRSEMVFQFDIYENQRWWLGMDWTTNMMPNERGPWTDVQLVSVPAKESFQLPVPSQTVEMLPVKGDGKPRKLIKTKTWSWVDSDWWVDLTGQLHGLVDHKGWEYGNNSWKQMNGKPDMQAFTRRRRWCRCARLVEEQIVETGD